jgi:hypothetical protein
MASFTNSQFPNSHIRPYFITVKIDHSILFSGQVSYPQTTYSILMIWSKRCLVGPRIALDVVNPRKLELETAKEILGELFDIRMHEVEDLIRQWMEERTLYDQEFLSAALKS